MRRIAFMNQKGGVGKTTTVANLGAAFAALGRRVLVIDIDPQANLSTHLGFDLDGGEPTIYEVLTRRLEVKDAIVQTETPGLTLLPSSIDLSGAEIELVQEMGRETILKGAVDEHVASLPEEERPEFVLVDCPPSLGLLSLNALTTVTEVMIPIQTQFFALRGMSKLLEVVKLVQARLNPRLEITAIIPSMADLRTNLTGEVIQEIKRYFGTKVSRTIVRTNIRLAEAPSFGKSIFDYDKSARGAQDFLRLAKELLGELPAEIPDLDPGREPEREPKATVAGPKDPQPEPEREPKATVAGPKDPQPEPEREPKATVAGPKDPQPAPAPDPTPLPPVSGLPAIQPRRLEPGDD